MSSSIRPAHRALRAFGRLSVTRPTRPSVPGGEEYYDMKVVEVGMTAPVVSTLMYSSSF